MFLDNITSIPHLSGAYKKITRWSTPEREDHAGSSWAQSTPMSVMIDPVWWLIIRAWSQITTSATLRVPCHLKRENKLGVRLEKYPPTMRMDSSFCEDLKRALRIYGCILGRTAQVEDKSRYHQTRYSEKTHQRGYNRNWYKSNEQCAEARVHGLYIWLYFTMRGDGKRVSWYAYRCKLGRGGGG